MNRLDAKKHAIARQSAKMLARRRFITEGVADVHAVTRRVASKPSTLAAAGLCGAIFGYLASSPKSFTRPGGRQTECRNPVASALQAGIRLASFVPTGVAILNALSGGALQAPTPSE